MVRLLCGLVCLGCFAPSVANTQPVMRPQDKIRIREAISISEQIGNKIWPRYNNVPFAVLLVTDSVEFLMNHPNPSLDFNRSEFDSLLSIDIYFRKRIFDTHLLATFPAVQGIPCIVIGQPENTKLNSTEWVITLLHEHFHQYQYSQKDYYESVNGLDLAGGDESGMWMLNYPFPYDSLPVKELFKNYTHALQQAVLNISNKNFHTSFRIYLAARKKFKKILNERDYRYFCFQLWQEGVSRLTEYLFLLQMKNYRPSLAFRQLDGFEDFNLYRKRIIQQEIENITKLSLNKARRISFYSVGFAEGLLLEKTNPDWKKNYFTKKFFMEGYFDTSR